MRIGACRLWIVSICLWSLTTGFRFIIIPGIGGSILYNDKSQRIWPPNLIGFNPKSFEHPYEIQQTTGRIGDVDSIRIDTGSTYALTKNTYYSGMIDFLEKENHVSAFPYDFRYIHLPDYHIPLYNSYKRYIEEEVASSKEKIIFVAHSMGGLVLQHFLHSFTNKQWAAKHIQRIYFLNVPFGGCPSALFLLADHLHNRMTFNSLPTRLILSVPNMRTFGGLYVCLPTTSGHFATLHKKEITYKNMPDLFGHDPGMSWALQMSKPFHDVSRKPPFISHVVIHGFGKNTTYYKNYDTEETRDTDGDGLVSSSSLLFLQKNDLTTLVSVENADHSNINNDVNVLSMISQNELYTRPSDEPKKRTSPRLFF